MTTETETIYDIQDRDAYFDDIEGHIEMLQDEADILDDCEKRDELLERIEYLKKCKHAGDKWVDNDITATPDAWKTLQTYTDKEALKAYRTWTK